jgi:hypothetical protein
MKEPSLVIGRWQGQKPCSEEQGLLLVQLFEASVIELPHPIAKNAIEWGTRRRVWPYALLVRVTLTHGGSAEHGRRHDFPL